MTKGIAFTEESASRIASAVRKVESDPMLLQGQRKKRRNNTFQEEQNSDSIIRIGTITGGSGHNYSMSTAEGNISADLPQGMLSSGETIPTGTVLSIANINDVWTILDVPRFI